MTSKEKMNVVLISSTCTIVYNVKTHKIDNNFKELKRSALGQLDDHKINNKTKYLSFQKSKHNPTNSISTQLWLLIFVSQVFFFASTS